MQHNYTWCAGKPDRVIWTITLNRLFHPLQHRRIPPIQNPNRFSTPTSSQVPIFEDCAKCTTSVSAITRHVLTVETRSSARIAPSDAGAHAEHMCANPTRLQCQKQPFARSERPPHTTPSVPPTFSSICREVHDSIPVRKRRIRHNTHANLPDFQVPPFAYSPIPTLLYFWTTLFPYSSNTLLEIFRNIDYQVTSLFPRHW